MMSSMKMPVTGLLFATVVAVLPTLIIAHLAATPQQPLPNHVNAAGDDLSMNDPIEKDSAGPATRPSRAGGNEGAPGGGFGGGFGAEGRNRPGPIGPRWTATPEEIQTVLDFYNQNSPKRMAYFAKLPEGSPARHFAINKMVQTYRPMQNFKESDPDLYALLVKQVKLRDDAFELARKGDDAALRAKSAEIVSTSLDARTMRLELLQKQFAEQQTQLESDKANPDAAAEREVAVVKQDEQRIVNAVMRIQNRQRGQSMLDLDPAADPLADAAPIAPDIEH